MKLLTQEIIKHLPNLNALDGLDNKEKNIAVKFFCPWNRYTWYVLEGEKQEDGDWLFYGYVQGNHPDCDEFGYFVLSELQNLKGLWGLKVERDLHFKGTMADVLKGSTV